jgi:hypothetical protein
VGDDADVSNAFEGCGHEMKMVSIYKALISFWESQ